MECVVGVCILLGFATRCAALATFAFPIVAPLMFVTACGGYSVAALLRRK